MRRNLVRSRLTASTTKTGYNTTITISNIEPIIIGFEAPGDNTCLQAKKDLIQKQNPNR